MSKIDVYIPKYTKKLLKRQIKIAVSKGEQQWKFASSEEDALTGALCSLLQSDWKNFSPKDRMKGKWKIEYKKFRSKGKNADEKIVGADGIIQLTVYDKDKNITFQKGLLFQAKKIPITGTGKFKEQIDLLKNINESSSIVLLFSDSGFYASELKNVEKGKIKKKERILSTINGKFIECKIGSQELYYDFESESLIYNGKKIGEYLKESVNIKIQQEE
jgi:hypothetical protein